MRTVDHINSDIALISGEIDGLEKRRLAHFLREPGPLTILELQYFIATDELVMAARNKRLGLYQEMLGLISRGEQG